MIIMLIESIAYDATLVSAFKTVFYISAAGAGLSGALFSEKVRRLRFLYLWMALGSLSSFLLIFMDNVAVGHLLIIFIFLGISFGLGMPSSLAFLGDFTSVENRGLVSSLIFLAANLSTLPLAVLLMALNPVIGSIILTVWRGLGLIIFTILNPKEENLREEKKNISFISVFRRKTFSLYLLPWVMFILVDTFEKALLTPILKQSLGLDFLRSMLTIEPIIAVFFMFISGLLADRIGRKRLVIYGFVSLGIGYAIVGLAPPGYAIMGLAPQSMMELAWYFYMIVDGAAAGILLTMFLFILWGDISQPGNREKYYAVGSFPFLIRSTIPLLLITVNASVELSAAFSLASFFLFLAVLPLMYAPETLPRKNIEMRQLKGYVEQAKKAMEKYSGKSASED